MLHMRRVRAAFSIVAALCVALPASGSGAVTIGQSPPTVGTVSNCGPGVGAQLSVSSGNAYAVPSGGGVITRWRSSFSGTAALQIFRPAGANHVLVADDQRTIGGNLTEFEVRIPVEGADRIGLRIPGPVTNLLPGCAFSTANPGDVIGVRDNAPVGSPVPLSPVAGFRFNVAADVEPDADADGYGDETQDGCPTDASRQTDCEPPETKITKIPPNKITKAKAKYKFTSDETGSRFECSLKGKGLDQAVKQFGDCDSPRKYKGLDEGKFKFKVRAIDAAGNVDPSPAKDKFKVVG